MNPTRIHGCEDGYVRCASPLIGPALRACRRCQPVCPTCRGAGCFAPGWIGDAAEVAEAILNAAGHGLGFDLCPRCGGVVDMCHIGLVEGDAMTAIRITRHSMTGETTRHGAVGTGDAWWVTWLPGRRLTYNQAVTAMTIAETVAATSDLDPDHRLWPFLRDWAAELDLSPRDATTRACADPSAGHLSEGDQP